MTGFAQARRDTAAGALTMSLRSVNHRGLDLHFYQSHEFAGFENGMRALLKERIGRGHLEIRAGLVRENGVRGALNTEALKNYASLFQSAVQELGLDDKPNLNSLLTLPGVVTMQSPEAQELGTDFEGLLLSLLNDCISALNECRAREGLKLGEEMLGELAEVEAGTAQIRDLRATILAAFQEWLRERMRELLGDSGIPDSRIVEECAVLADRSDIQEEVTRLTVHSIELKRMLAEGGAVGKQIEFLLQEMNRETNTLLAKSSNAGEPGLKITGLALGIKANIERIREQALNLE